MLSRWDIWRVYKNMNTRQYSRLTVLGQGQIRRLALLALLRSGLQ